MTTFDHDKLGEALTLLEFTQDITTAWNLDAVQPTDDSMYGLTFLLRQITDKIREACHKEG